MTAGEFVGRLSERGVRMGAYKDERVRAVTHLGITEADVLEAARAVHEMLVEVRLGA